MADLNELRDRLEALRNARASGVRSVEFTAGNGTSKRVEYRSDGELAAAIGDLEGQIAALTGQRIRSIRFQTSKGFQQ